jgi:hypothetical protein
MREFLISVASGLVVALISALFRRDRGRGPGGMSQTMSNTTVTGGGVTRTVLAFLIGAAVVYVVLQYNLLPLNR